MTCFGLHQWICGWMAALSNESGCLQTAQSKVAHKKNRECCLRTPKNTLNRHSFETRSLHRWTLQVARHCSATMPPGSGVRCHPKALPGWAAPWGLACCDKAPYCMAFAAPRKQNNLGISHVLSWPSIPCTCQSSGDNWALVLWFVAGVACNGTIETLSPHRTVCVSNVVIFFSFLLQTEIVLWLSFPSNPTAPKLPTWLWHLRSTGTELVQNKSVEAVL